MTKSDLSTKDGLRAAIQSLGSPNQWRDNASEWMRRLGETIQWVRDADERTRATREFQDRLWEHNHVAAIGQGNIRVDEALDDKGFRQWLAGRSLQPLPPQGDARLQFLTGLYDDLKSKLEALLTRHKTPHLKIFRVMAALYPEGMTTIAALGKINQLAKAMGSAGKLDPVERHTFVRSRIDEVLGEVPPTPQALAERMGLAWVLYARYVQDANEITESETEPGDQTRLLPLPAARRRRGLTPIRGLFPGVLSTLEFARDGVTREELLDFLRASSPDAKASSLGVSVNVLQGELGVIRLDGNRYVLTERGEDVLESQDPNHLADWILTRILGADRAIVELRDRGPLVGSELQSAIRSMNPGWKTNFVPQGIIGWLRSMGVIETTPENKQSLTELGQAWAKRIDWKPEPLPPEPDEGIAATAVAAQITDAAVQLPDIASIITRVQTAGHFPASAIARLHAGLWSHDRRHFAILAGLSGSGKTLLAREYGNAITAEAVHLHFTLSVQPGWHDPSALLGFTNPLRGDSYSRTAFLEFMLAAVADPTKPYVVILDEMNLSHPEQYMAPLLSAMETGEPIELHTEGEFFDGVPSAVVYPRNLVLIGTVNMDETTHGLADKILDRAFVLEFWDVDLAAYPRWGTRAIAASDEKRARDVLVALMEALAPARLHFGWRVVDDVLNFLDCAAAAGAALPFESALDSVIYAKVLPKLRGDDSPRFREALAGCEEKLKSFGLSESGRKIAELRRDVESTGSARFWR
jgi:5-methylcytosine-specific restriction protein B